jgi:hypothetical protein
MDSITSTAGLKNAIQLLEAEQATALQLLKEQLAITYHSFKPVNFLAGAFNRMTSSPNLIENILGTSVGLATGYLSKKIVVGASVNIFRKLFGSVLQLGVTNLITRHPDAFKTFGRFVLRYFLHRKSFHSKNHESKSSRAL